jgi:hypothetical protein
MREKNVCAYGVNSKLRKKVHFARAFFAKSESGFVARCSRKWFRKKRKKNTYFYLSEALCRQVFFGYNYAI